MSQRKMCEAQTCQESGTMLRNDLLVVVKETNTPQANIGDVISYTITLTNNTNSVITNIRLTNLIDKSLQVETNSIGINGVVSFRQTLSNLPLPDLQPGMQHQVVFNVTVMRAPGEDQTIRETTVVTYFYQGQKYRSESNTIQVLINVPAPVNNYIESILEALPATAHVGDVVSYVLKVYPINRFNIIEAQVTLNLDTNLQFIPGTLVVDGRPACDNLIQIPLPDLTSQNMTKPKCGLVQFKARITALPTAIRPFTVVSATISYQVCELGQSFTDISNDALVEVLPSILTYTYQMEEQVELLGSVQQILGVNILNANVIPGVNPCDLKAINISFVASIIYLDCLQGVRSYDILQTVPVRYAYVQQTSLSVQPCISKLVYKDCHISLPITIILSDQEIID